MDVGYTSSRLFKMETNYLYITAPVRPPISLHAPDARQGAARFPAPRYAYHDKQLF